MRRVSQSGRGETLVVVVGNATISYDNNLFKTYWSQKMLHTVF